MICIWQSVSYEFESDYQQVYTNYLSENVSPPYGHFAVRPALLVFRDQPLSDLRLEYNVT